MHEIDTIEFRRYFEKKKKHEHDEESVEITRDTKTWRKLNT